MNRSHRADGPAAAAALSPGYFYDPQDQHLATPMATMIRIFSLSTVLQAAFCGSDRPFKGPIARCESPCTRSSFVATRRTPSASRRARLVYVGTETT